MPNEAPVANYGPRQIFINLARYNKRANREPVRAALNRAMAIAPKQHYA